MILIAFLMFSFSMFFTGCADVHALRIGEKVSNGVCFGWIASETSYQFKIVPWTCNEVRFNFAMVPKEQVYSIDSGKKQK